MLNKIDSLYPGDRRATSAVAAGAGSSTPDLWGALNWKLQNTVTLPDLDGTATPAPAPSGSGDLYFVSYNRKGDPPDGGELYGIYSTKAQADKAVADIKKWAATITDPTWQIGKIEVEKMAGAPPIKDDATAKKGPPSPTPVAKTGSPPTPGTSPKATAPRGESSAKKGEEGGKKEEGGGKELAKKTMEGLEKGLGRTGDSLKKAIAERTNTRLQAQRIIAQNRLAGKISQGEALRQFRGVNRAMNPEIEALERQLKRVEVAEKVFGAAAKVMDVIEIGEEVLKAPTWGEKAYVAARAITAKASGAALTDLIITSVVDATGLALAAVSLPEAIAAGVVIGGALLAGDVAEGVAKATIRGLRDTVDTIRDGLKARSGASAAGASP